MSDASWQGSAQQTYCGESADQRGRVLSIAGLDSKLAGIVQDRADSVAYVRWGFGILMALLAAAYIYELETAAISLPVGVFAAKSYATVAAWVGIGVAVTMVFFLLGWSIYNGQRENGVADGYHTLTNAGGALTGAEVSAAGSMAGGVETVLTNVSAMADIASVADGAGIRAPGEAGKVFERTSWHLKWGVQQQDEPAATPAESADAEAGWAPIAQHSNFVPVVQVVVDISAKSRR